MYILAQVNWLEELARYLGQMFGVAVGNILAFLAYLLILYLLWGLPWTLIIKKAGFQGRAYWILLYLLFGSLLVAFLAFLWFGPYSVLSNVLGGLAGFCVYLGVLILAFAPWAVRKELLQMRKTQSGGGD